MYSGKKVKPPVVVAHNDRQMTVNFEFDGPWSFKGGDTMRVVLGEKEANELLRQLMAELARIQKGGS